jgi:3-oxoadipate enol-lactonase
VTQLIPPAETVGLGDVRLAVRQCGSGEALLLVHGLGASSELWCNQFEAFGRRFRIIAPDLRGFGRSDKPKTAGCYSIDKFADDLIQLVRTLGIGKLHYLGTSMGGFIGQAISLREPDLLGRLILVHTAAKMSIPRQILDARLKALREMTMDDYARMVAEQALADGAVSKLFDWLSKMIAANDRISYAQVLNEALAGFDLSKELSKIKLPALIVVGDQDRVIPPQAGYELAAGIQGAKVYTLKHAGHIGYAEQPGTFNDLILSFLDGRQSIDMEDHDGSR